jgi:hypothetical protein
MLARHATLAAVVTLLVGCADPELAPETTAEPAPSADTRDDRPTAPAHPPELTACRDDVVAATAEAIAGQLAAFAADDYETALLFASRDFRAGTDATAFEDLIEQDHPVVADVREHRPRECLQEQPDAAEVRVELTGQDGARSDLLYLLVVEDGAWRIAGAIELEREGVLAA